MRDCRRVLIVAAALLITLVGAARAEQESSSSQQTSSFWSWLFPSSSPASTPRPAPTGRAVNAAEPAKVRQNCTLLTCVTLVGVGF